MRASELLPLLREPEVMAELRTQLGLPQASVTGMFDDIRALFRETEAKNRVREREVRAFASKLARLEAPHPIFGVLVGHFIDREAESIGRELGVAVVSTVGLRR